MQRALLGAIGIGFLIGGSLYAGEIADPLLALGTGAVFAGWGYFLLAHHNHLSPRALRFSNRSDQLGHAIGLFGAAILPTAVGNTLDGSIALVVVIGFLGVIGFLVTLRGIARPD